MYASLLSANIPDFQKQFTIVRVVRASRAATNISIPCSFILLSTSSDLETTFLWYFAFNERIMLIDCVFDVELGGREKNLTVFNLKVDDRLIVDH